jgi:hypothetical protein
MQGLPWLLVRLLHVLTGVVWAGAAVLIAGHLMPAVRAAGTGGTAVMKQLTVVQRLPAKLAFLGITAIASGGYLLWIESAGLSSNWMNTGPGITYCVGAIATLLAAIIGFGINIPAANRMGALAAAVHARPEGATSMENQTLGRLAARIARGTRAVALLLVLATASMAAARYIP